MKRKRLLILLGTLIALIFFYVGLNKWLESKPESAPPPVVVRPAPPQPIPPLQEEEAKEEPKVEEKKQTLPAEPQKQKEDLIAQKIQEEKAKEVQKTHQKQEARKEVAKQEKQAEKPKGEVKEYVIQIGAFSLKENADRVLKKAKSMGYRGEIVNEDNFYKVRVRVKTDDPKKVLAKLKATFGGAIIKQ